MTGEYGFQAPERGVGIEGSALERVERIKTKLRDRDTQQTALLGLLSQPENAENDIARAWLDLRVAQHAVDQLIEVEIDGRI